MNHLSEEILIEYADGLLSEELRRTVELHIKDCDACLEQIELYKSFNELMISENKIKAPAVLTDKIMAKVEYHQKLMVRKAHSRKVALNFLLIMFSIVLAISILLILSPQQNLSMPQWAFNSYQTFNNWKIPSFNPFVLVGIIPLMVILITERFVIKRKNHKIGFLPTL